MKAILTLLVVFTATFSFSQKVMHVVKYGQETTYMVEEIDSIYFTDFVETEPVGDFEYGTLTDIDGNTYKTIVIGTQTWMAEDLRVKKLNNGTPILIKQSSTDWYNALLNNEIVYSVDEKGEKGSYLYSVDALKGDNICPVGWHIPSGVGELNGIMYDDSKDWGKLANFSGGIITGTEKLENGYVDINQVSYPTGLYGLDLHNTAERDEYGLFEHTFGIRAAYNDGTVSRVYIRYTGEISEYSQQIGGFAVRCVKD